MSSGCAERRRVGRAHHACTECCLVGRGFLAVKEADGCEQPGSGADCGQARFSNQAIEANDGRDTAD